MLMLIGLHAQPQSEDKSDVVSTFFAFLLYLCYPPLGVSLCGLQHDVLARQFLGFLVLLHIVDDKHFALHGVW